MTLSGGKAVAHRFPSRGWCLETDGNDERSDEFLARLDGVLGLRVRPESGDVVVFVLAVTRELPVVGGSLVAADWRRTPEVRLRTQRVFAEVLKGGESERPITGLGGVALRPGSWGERPEGAGAPKGFCKVKKKGACRHAYNWAGECCLKTASPARCALRDRMRLRPSVFRDTAATKGWKQKGEEGAPC